MLRAVDTNVLARALVADAGEQGQKASDVLRDGAVFIPETVLLETEWLLRSQLGVARKAVNVVLSNLISLPNVHFDNVAKIANALSAHKEGMDFADALHLFSAGDCQEMLSFDREFSKRARKIANSVPVREP